MTALNEFTGIRTATLHARMRKCEKREAAMKQSEADGESLGGGSPYEALYEEMDALEAEINRREIEVS